MSSRQLFEVSGKTPPQMMLPVRVCHNLGLPGIVGRSNVSLVEGM